MGTESKKVTKFDEGKPRFDLVPTAIQFEVAQVYTDGAKVHGVRNWEHGLPVSKAYASALRHINKFWAAMHEGDIDPDHGTHHLAHAIVELQMIHETLRIHPELDDRPHHLHNALKEAKLVTGNDG